jgi:hypothetical protein
VFTLASLSAAQAQTEFGLPSSAERQAYCQAAQPECLKAGRKYCQSPANSTPDCLEDAETQCSKAMSHCVEAGAQAAASPSPTPATADCGLLYRRLFAYARQASSNRIFLVWTTNYYAHEVRYGGVSAFELRADANDLFGDGQRRRTLLAGAGAETENVSLRIRQDGQITLSGIYGPYRTTCSDNRFATARTGDSVETFHFFLPPATAGKPPKEKDVAEPPPPDRPILR